MGIRTARKNRALRHPYETQKRGTGSFEDLCQQNCREESKGGKKKGKGNGPSKPEEGGKAKEGSQNGVFGNTDAECDTRLRINGRGQRAETSKSPKITGGRGGTCRPETDEKKKHRETTSSVKLAMVGLARGGETTADREKKTRRSETIIQWCRKGRTGISTRRLVKRKEGRDQTGGAPIAQKCSFRDRGGASRIGWRTKGKSQTEHRGGGRMLLFLASTFSASACRV